MRVVAVAVALTGGLAWLAAFVLAQTEHGQLADVVGWLGLVLLALAVLGAGAGLVSRSATWLRIVVAVCFALLAWSLLQLVGGGHGGSGIDAVAGGIAAVLATILLARPRPASGAHSRE